jgi:hypothetical protein
MTGFDEVTTLTLLSAWALAIGTVGLMYWQTRQAQRLNSSNSIMALRERFDSPHMRRARKHLSSRLMNHQHEDITSVEVATFFELIGALTHRKVLDADLVWEAFGTWISGYYFALRNPVDTIAKVREDLQDPLVLHEFEWLNGRVSMMDAHELGPQHSTVQMTEEQARVILKREADLDLQVS